MALENIDMERAVLGAAIIGGEFAHAALLGLDSSDFTDTRHRVIAGVIRDMVTHGHPVDLLTVADELVGRGKLSAPGGAGGAAYLHTLAGPGILPISAGYYAEAVRTATRVRMANLAALDLADKTRMDEAADEIDALLRTHRAAIDAIPGLITDDNDDHRDTVGSILGEPDKAEDWVIPGWLAREERAVIVAGEGVAKTTLLRQFAVCLAAGLNPWDGRRVADGQRVLFIDAENSRNQSRRAYRWISGRCVGPMAAHGWKDRIIHKTRNDGVDLPGRDLKWFIDVAARVAPDVLILGPAYKLMRGDPQKDRDVQDLLDVIDKVRVQQGCAVLVETHSPHGMAGARQMRPYGSSVWLRWPEIGIGYQRDESEEIVQQVRPDHLEAVEWRGARESRDWPDLIQYGPRNGLPWVPTRLDWRPSVDSQYQIPSEGEAA